MKLYRVLYDCIHIYLPLRNVPNILKEPHELIKKALRTRVWFTLRGLRKCMVSDNKLLAQDEESLSNLCDIKKS